MPVVFVEAPPGVRPDVKKRMMRKITDALEEAYPIGETLIFLREYPLENVAENGGLQSENPKVLEAVAKTRNGRSPGQAAPDGAGTTPDQAQSI